jgi:hypothetical protein
MYFVITSLFFKLTVLKTALTTILSVHFTCFLLFWTEKSKTLETKKEKKLSQFEPQRAALTPAA